MSRLLTSIDRASRLRRVTLAALMLVVSGSLRAAELLQGAIDIHCHTAPDALPRSVSDVELARMAQGLGMRAIVLKNHYTATADRAWLAMQAVPGIEIFGGVALNRALGGLNPEAVVRMAEMHGRRGKIVWLPTWDAEYVVRRAGERRPAVATVVDGQVVPELAEIFRVVVQHDLVLATGHASAREALIIVAAAQAAGVKRILVTHALFPPLDATRDLLVELAGRGAYLELVWLQHFYPPKPVPNAPPSLAIEAAVATIRAVKAEHVILASDFGQAGNPPPPEGLNSFMTSLRAAGINDADLNQMTRINPARLLGLP